MRAEDILVEVRDKQLNRLGTILPEDLDITVTDQHNKLGSWTLTLPAEHPMSGPLLTPGSGILVAAGGLAFSGPTLQPEFASSADDGLGTVVIKGVCDKVILADALAFPEPANSNPATQSVGHDEATGTSEGLMNYYVRRNIGTTASVARKNPNLIVADHLNRGTVATKQPRFPVLADLLNEIAVIDGMGYRVTQQGSTLVFETYQTSDRRLDVRLSMLNGELDSQKVATSAPGATRAIVGGKGDLAARKFVEVTTTDSLAAEALWGRRIETFIDQRQSNLTSELQAAGAELLAEQGFTFASVQAMPTEDSSLVFGVDWGLGDLVTIEVDGIETTSFASGYVLKANSDGVLIGVILGDENDFSEAGRMRSQLASVTRQVSALERNAEAVTSASGSVVMSPGSSGSITFPAGTFSTPPFVQLTATSTGNVACLPLVSGISSTGCTSLLYAIEGTWSSGNITVYWTATASP